MDLSLFDDMESMAQAESWIHFRDPRAKLAVTAAFIVTVVSFPRTEVSALLPLGLFLVWWASLAQISLRWLSGRVAVPVLLLGILGAANLLFERGVEFHVGSFPVTTGILSWLSIVLRALFSLTAILLLTTTTGISSLAGALARLGASRLLVTLLLLLFRYIFVLADEATRMNRARISRSFGRRGVELRVAAQILGHLVVRALGRAERIHAAMLARDFGEGKAEVQGFSWKRQDTVFLIAACLFLLAVRLGSLSRVLGHLILGALPS